MNKEAIAMIYVVRHGQTDVNKEGRMQGRRGLPLNEAGLEQARALRERLQDIKFDYIYSSPQERAVQTAEMATGLKAVIDERLNVFDLGDADGLFKHEVRLAGGVPDPELYKGVEELDSYISRVYDFMNELRTRLNRTDAADVNILIAGHKCTTGCIGAYFEGMPQNKNILKFSSGNADFKVYQF
jgi:uncharacterized phosphatase